MDPSHQLPEHHHHHAHLLASTTPEAWTFVAMLVYSLSVSAHCFAMCGPLLSNALVQDLLGGRGSLLRKLLAYHAGRGLAYTLAGGLAGFVGQSVSRGMQWFDLGQKAFSTVFGLVLLLMAFAQLRGGSTLKILPDSWNQNALRLLSLSIHAAPVWGRGYVLGFLTVFLPCMTLTPTLLVAASTGEAFLGASLLFAFFLGTVPAMTAVGFVSSVRLPKVIPVRWVAFFFLALAGVATLLRATPWVHSLH